MKQRHSASGTKKYDALTCFHTLDFLIHEWLGEHGLVLFAVPIAPVADQVQNDILLKTTAILDGDPRRVAHSFCVVAVHVNGRRINGFRYICSTQLGGSIRCTLVVQNGENNKYFKHTTFLSNWCSHLSC